MDECSDSAISFRYASPNPARLVEYLIFRVRPVGASRAHRKTQSAEGNATAIGVPWDSTTLVEQMF